MFWCCCLFGVGVFRNEVCFSTFFLIVLNVIFTFSKLNMICFEKSMNSRALKTKSCKKVEVKNGKKGQVGPVN